MTGTIDTYPARGWIFYDARCLLCVAAMRRARPLLESRGYQWVPLQTPDAAARLGVATSAFETRMHLLTGAGRVVYNADALSILCRSVWWLWPLGALLALPPFRQLGRLGYDWLARNRYCLGGQCSLPSRHQQTRDWTAWAPFALLPILAGTLAWHRPTHSYAPWAPHERKEPL